MRKLLLLLLAVGASTCLLQAQTRAISGKVTSTDGSPIPNTSVIIKGTGFGTSTKFDGTYSMNVPEGSKILVFTAVGMADAEVSIGNKAVINIQLQSTDKNLAEVVVVGYGTQKRKEITGNFSTVKGTEIAEKPVQSFESALAGKAAGVQITVPNGVVNNPPVFRIRGTNSISLSSYPLIVIDGIATYTGDQGGTSAPANPLASINPGDIESIDIAKDAAAAAIYGSRAANGVVFITTKKGKSGRAKVNYDGWVGFSKANRLPEVLNAQEYVDFKNMALDNLKAVNAATTGSFIIPKDANGNPINTNWYDEVYRQGFSHSHNVNVSGGNESTTYYFSAGYTSQQGILKKNEFIRSNILTNVDSRVTKWLNVGGKISYSNEKNRIAGTSGSLPGEAFNSAGAARLAVALPSNTAPYNNDGTYNIASATAIGGMGSLVNGANPYTFNNITMLLNLNRSNNEANHLQSNVYVQVKPLSWITLRSTYGIDNLLLDNEIFLNPYHGDGTSGGSGPGGGATGSYIKYKTWLWTNTAQFDYSFGDIHNFSLLVGNEQQRRTYDGFGINRRTLSDSAYTVIQAGFTTNNTSGMILSENYLLSSFGRLNYNFNKKYFISANLRQDEYSALGVKKGTFYGFSGGWEIARESFWNTLGIDNIFSSFRLRGSYGKVGNISGIGDFETYSTYSSGLYGGNPTLFFSTVGNNKIEWETSTKTDVGIVFGLFNDRVRSEITYYKNNIDNLLLRVPQSPSVGLPNGNSVLMNVGKMYNQGIEFMADAQVISTKDFNWNTTFNFSYNKNVVTALADGLTEVVTSTSGLETVNKTVVGKSAGYLWVVPTAGVDPTSGRRIFVNASGEQILFQNSPPAGQTQFMTTDNKPYLKNNGRITQPDDGVLYANVIPKYVGGWTNTVNYKDFDLNFLFTYQLGAYIYYGTNAGLHDMRFWNNDKDVLTDSWQKPGDNAKYAKPVYGDNSSNGSAMPLDINVFKGDFVKLRTVQIGYNLPKSILDKVLISRARFYVAGQNLAVITKYPGPDPEVSSNGNSGTSFGVDRNTLGNGRTITVGLNVGF
ncbi:SusC/RagA family TonB-linked outer membrane protein [Niastella populi]|uniref:SusC/RagA family TonB-linked outer membrane protein n=1 Tax=Niastella populi TaxID=550983 RepID=A0A1V9FJL8_9BACT|nr:SusC/RagA family TonB-linked outer membrane protein [Niastella populi]OQP58542.1 SusC/RagA family TonB-linked outer membrane protein [Niastella populi]